MEWDSVWAVVVAEVEVVDEDVIEEVGTGDIKNSNPIT
jgi:hypothetical protein